MAGEPRSALAVLNGTSTTIRRRHTISKFTGQSFLFFYRTRANKSATITTTIIITIKSPTMRVYLHQHLRRVSTGDRQACLNQAQANPSITIIISRQTRTTTITITTIMPPALISLCRMWQPRCLSRSTRSSTSWRKLPSDLVNISGHSCTRPEQNCPNPTHHWTINLAMPRSHNGCLALT